jgi:hypothetical protein
VRLFSATRLTSGQTIYAKNFVFLIKVDPNSQINAASVDRTLYFISIVIINQVFLTWTYQCLQISISEVDFSLALSQLLIVSVDS